MHSGIHATADYPYDRCVHFAQDGDFVDRAITDFSSVVAVTRENRGKKKRPPAEVKSKSTSRLPDLSDGDAAVILASFSGRRCSEGNSSSSFDGDDESTQIRGGNDRCSSSEGHETAEHWSTAVAISNKRNHSYQPKHLQSTHVDTEERQLVKGKPSSAIAGVTSSSARRSRVRMNDNFVESVAQIYNGQQRHSRINSQSEMTDNETSDATSNYGSDDTCQHASETRIKSVIVDQASGDRDRRRSPLAVINRDCSNDARCHRGRKSKSQLEDDYDKDPRHKQKGSESGRHQRDANNDSSDFNTKRHHHSQQRKRQSSSGRGRRFDNDYDDNRQRQSHKRSSSRKTSSSDNQHRRDKDDHSSQHHRSRQYGKSCGSARRSGGSDDSSDNSDDDRHRRGRAHGRRTKSRHRHNRSSGSDDSASRTRTNHKSSRNQRWMKPDKFNGHESFETFMCTFTNCAECNAWSEKDKRAYLRWSLSGEAAQLLWDANDLSYDQLVEKLRNRFGGKGMEERFQTELRCRRRRKGESIRELAQDIRKLLSLAYPGEKSRVVEHIARDAFLTALDDPELELKIREREPEDLDAAVRFAQRSEVSRGIVEAASSSQVRHRVTRQVTECNNPPTAEFHDLDARVIAVEHQLSQIPPYAQQSDNSPQSSRSYEREKSREKSNTKQKRRNRAVTQDDGLWKKQTMQKMRELEAAQAASHEQAEKLAAENDQLHKELSRFKHLELMRRSSSFQLSQPRMDQSATQPPVRGNGNRTKTADGCWSCGQTGHLMRSCSYVHQQQQGARSGPNSTASSQVAGTSKNCHDVNHRPAYIRAQIAESDQICLLDSGSEVTVLPASIVDCSLLQPTTETLKAANGTEIPVLGKATVPFKTDSYSSNVTGLVSEHVAEVMLGIDWLIGNNAAWDFRGANVQLGGQPHRLTARHDARKWCRRVVLQEDIEVPARTQLDLPCKVVFQRKPANIRDVHWTTQTKPIAEGVHVARTLIPVDKFVDVPVRIMNVQRQPRFFCAGTIVSDLEPTSVIEAAISHRDETTDNGETTVKSLASNTVSEKLHELVEGLIDGVDAATPESSVIGLRELLLHNVHVFSESEYDLGRTDIVTHRIITNSERPVRQQLRKFPPAQVEAISTHVDNMLQQQVIEPAASPWASNVVLVRKKDGTYRCCIDYRQLNNVTVRDGYPLPRVDSCLDSMADAKWFSTFDLRSSYHQVSVAPEDRDKTAFICPRGMYRFRTMPFGLCNAGATFQRLMDIVMSGLHLEICLVYLDDIVVYSGTAKQHLERLQMVFDRLSAAGLKLKPEKCKFFQKSVMFLGHVISDRGIGTDPAKIAQVADWPAPTSVSELRTFLGLASYYRRFVRNFANIAAPLHALTKKNVQFRWSAEAQESFEVLKLALTTPPVLAMPTDEGEFTLDTDASERAIGAVLSQRQHGEERVIAYASRSLDRREQNYCITRKELLAIVHFLKYFKQYLLGRNFKVRTDHAALTWLRRTPDPIGQQARWLEQLEEFNFTVEHRPGVRHGNADAMSRRPCPKKDCGCHEPAPPLFGGPADQPNDESHLVAGTEVDDANVQNENNEQEPQTQEPPPTDAVIGNFYSFEAIRQAQQEDPTIRFICDLVESGASKPHWNDVSAKSKEAKVLWSFWPRLSVRNGLLCRHFEYIDRQDVHWQIILPKKLQTEFLNMIHAGVMCGHQGYKKTAAALQARVYWPTWATDLKTFLKQCSNCARYHRGTLRRQAEMQIPLSGEPWEKISVDITGPHPKSARGNQFILTIVDHFSKWAEAIPIRNHTAPTVARALVVRVFSRYGMPVQLLTDRGPEFESDLFKHLLDWLEIDKLRTTAYKPSTNGVVERFHRTLNTMMGKVVSESQRDWDERLPFVMSAYRASPHSSTGFSPNRLFLGHENRMPVDWVMGLPSDERPAGFTIDDYVRQQQERAEESYELVRLHLRTNAERRKVAYDVRVRKTQFSEGEWVWYYYPRRYQRRSPKWQPCYIGPFLIVRELPPVNYVIQRSARAHPIVVHADKLKKVLFKDAF